MAVGGPYTPRAAGEDMTEALVMGQEQASAPVGLAPLSGPEQGQQMPQQAQQAPQGNARFGIQQPQLNPRRAYSARAYSAQEFYPGQERPNESRTGGGDPIWAASSGRIGWGVIADRATEIQRQKQELKDALAKANDFSGQAAPQYEREYQKWVAQEDMRWKQEYANQYHGGNLNRALKAIYTDPQANAMYLAHARDKKAAGIANKYYVPQAQNYVDGVLSGKVEKDPELFQAAQEMLSGGLKFSGPNTPAAALMADRGRQWEKLSSRAQLFEDTVKDRLATAVDTYVKEGKVRWENGAPVVDQVEQRNFDSLIDQTAREWENQYGIDSFQVNKEWLNANLGRMLKETKDFGPRPPASGGGGSSPESKVWTSPVTVAMANTNSGGSLSTTVDKPGVQRRTPTVETISVGKVVGDRQEPFGTLSFRDGNTIKRMNWVSIDRGADGKIELVGFDPNDTDTQTNIDDLNNQIGDLNAIIRSKDTDAPTITQATKQRDELTRQLRTSQKTSRKVRVPLEGNESAANGYLGGTLNQVIAKFNAQQAAPAKGKETNAWY